MNLKELVGKSFQENELYELLQFEIEDNFENYFGLFFHIYFNPLTADRLIVTDLAYFKNEDGFVKANKALIGKKGFFRIYENAGHVDMNLCRLDSSGKFSVIDRDHTHTEEWGTEYVDDLNQEPMTEEELRQAFQALGQLFETQITVQNLKTKKAV